MISAPSHQIIQSFNRIYAPIFRTQARYIDIWGGRGRGGSHTASDYALHLITKPNYFRGYFVRQVFGDIRDSLFRDFKDRIANNGTVNIDDFNIQENEMRVLYKPTGNLIISKGVKSEGGRTAKMKSLAGATHVFMEEADEVGEDDFDQMDDSLRTTQGEIQIIRVYNPPHKQHWWWGRHYTIIDSDVKGYFKAVPLVNNDFYVIEHKSGKKEVFLDKESVDKKYPGLPENCKLILKPKLLSIFSTYPDNIKNIDPSSQAKYESYKKNKPEYYYTVIKGLISEGMRGRVFSGWQKITNDEFNAIDARSIIGLDFGTSSPAGIVEVKLVKNNLYLRELNYVGMTIKEIGIKLCVLKIVKQTIIADSAEPESIVKLRTGWKKEELSEEEFIEYPQLLKGFNVFGVRKYKGSIVFGINKIKDHNVFLTEDSSNFWEEYRSFKWSLDKNKNPTDDPEDNYNHLHDPTNYVVRSKGEFF